MARLSALVFWRLTVRTVRRAVTREVLWTRVPRRFARPKHSHIEIIRFRAPREAERWLRSGRG
jgi:hypothetical protein